MNDYKIKIRIVNDIENERITHNTVVFHNFSFLLNKYFCRKFFFRIVYKSGLVEMYNLSVICIVARVE